MQNIAAPSRALLGASLGFLAGSGRRVFLIFTRASEPDVFLRRTGTAAKDSILKRVWLVARDGVLCAGAGAGIVKAAEATARGFRNPAKETLSKQFPSEMSMPQWLKGVFEPGWIRLNASRTQSRVTHGVRMAVSPRYRANNGKSIRHATHELGHGLVDVALDGKIREIAVGAGKLGKDAVGGYVLPRESSVTPATLIEAVNTQDESAYRNAMAQLFGGSSLSKVAGYSIQKAVYPHLFRDDLVRYARRSVESPVKKGTAHDFVQLSKVMQHGNGIREIAAKHGLGNAYPQLEFETVVRNADLATQAILKIITPEKTRAIASELREAKTMDGDQFNALLGRHLGDDFDWAPIHKIVRDFSNNPMQKPSP